MSVPGWKSRPAAETDELCGIAEAAALFGVKRATVDQWRSRNVMPDPEWDLRGGPIWRKSTLERWGRSTGRV